MTTPAPDDTMTLPAEAPAPAPGAHAVPDMVLTIPLNGKQAALVERVARMRSGNMDKETPVDLGAYVGQLISKDVAACLKEIQTRRGA